MKSTLKDFMPEITRIKLGNMPTLHINCMNATKIPRVPDGVARPGKTAKDKANGHIPYRKNRRVFDTDNAEVLDWYQNLKVTPPSN